MKKAFLILSFSILLLPLIASAITLNLDYPSFGGIDINNEEDQTLGKIVAWFYYLIVGISGLAAFAMLVFGGIQWLSSAGNPGRISDAKSRIQNALLGLLLILGSFLILQIINPELTILKTPRLDDLKVSPPGIGIGGGGGTNLSCPSPTNQGECNSILLQRAGWDRDLTSSASQVCQLESASQGISAFNRACLTGGWCDFSGGLFQINELYHCPEGIRRFNESTDPSTGIVSCNCQITNLSALNNCLARDGMPIVNQQGTVIGGSANGDLQRAAGKRVYDQQGWGAWFLSSKACNLI